MGAPKGSQNAKGNKGGGRSSAYKERADANLLWRLFTEPKSRGDIKKLLSLGKYSLMDVLVSKGFSGNERVLVKFMDKLFADRQAVEHSGPEGRPIPILQILSKKKS